MVGQLGQLGVKGDDVGLSKKRVFFHMFNAQFGADRTFIDDVIAKNAAIKGLQKPGNLGARVAKPDDADGLAGKLEAAVLVPVAGLQIQ